ncbi:MAG: hypothetical protein IIC08_04185 [Proteobacteria bacterium]|nr:hypothetical protein [Pseudomonadota bacterium]
MTTAADTPHVIVDPLTGRIDTGVEGFYDTDNALVKIEDQALNFDENEDDGDDAIFGGIGDDWLVGGTGDDHMYGGLGNDILNADDNLNTNGGLNDVADVDSGSDIAFGGGGRDMLIGNSGADRLIDWLGEFDNFVVPFKPFGAFTINRGPTPAMVEFLFALAESDGSDKTRIGGNFTDSDSEIGLVTSKDPLWGEQHGAPDGDQPGNGKGKKDTR